MDAFHSRRSLHSVGDDGDPIDPYVAPRRSRTCIGRRPATGGNQNEGTQNENTHTNVSSCQKRTLMANSASNLRSPATSSTVSMTGTRRLTSKRTDVLG